MKTAPGPAATPPVWDTDEMEPQVRDIMARIAAVREGGPYRARSDEQVAAMLQRFFEAEGLSDVVIAGLGRMSGGASKEQFVFTLAHRDAAAPERLVLRLDPLESISHTCRAREAQIQAALGGVVPVPPVRAVDASGEILGQPGMITHFVSGVTKPSDAGAEGVSGIGSSLEGMAGRLAPQFVDNLVRIHGFNWRATDLTHFTAPLPGTAQAALFQVNWWARAWREDAVEPVPMMTLAERWLRANAPVTDDPVVVHGDYRMGNFMFAEPGGEFTAVMDWELAHIGDRHEDMAWSLQRLFGTRRADGVFLASGLLPRAEFIAAYEARSGEKICETKLRYFTVLNAYKCAVMALATSMQVAVRSHNHQDLVLTWLAGSGAVFLNHMAVLIEEQNNAAQH